LEGLLLQWAKPSHTALLDGVLTKVGNVLKVVGIELWRSRLRLRRRRYIW
jgi:hypothetical protein